MDPAAHLQTQLIPLRSALIVDAVSQVSAALCGVLSREEWNIVHAPDNRSVLRLVETRPFDLIITGTGSTGKEDIDLLRIIRRVRPHVRLIILTDESTPADVVAAIRERAFSYFSTPFSTASFAEMLRCATTEPPWDDGIELVSATPEWISIIARCDKKTADRLVQFDPNQYVEVAYVRTSDLVMCRIKDPGQGFSLGEIHHAAVNNPSYDPIRHILFRAFFVMCVRAHTFAALSADFAPLLRHRLASSLR